MELPKIGMGTFGSDRYDEETVANAVYNAIKLGYRLFDCASVYGNEKQIGGVFKRAIDEGIVKRSDLIVTSKVWNDKHAEGEVIASCKQTIEDLGLGYIDIYFMHWPFPNYHAKGCTVDSRNPDSKPFIVEDFMIAWRQMEQLQREGLVKHIALSNMTVPKFEAVLPLCEIKPYAHEMELHPSFQQTELFNYCKANGMEVIAYCPLGSPNRPERDRTPEDVADTEMPEIKAIAKAHGWHVAEVCLKWAIQRGQTPIPFASQERNLINNFGIPNRENLSDAEMASIAAADKNSRLIKGHVFLWNGAADWRDLWDVDGTIADWKQDKSGKWYLTNRV